MSRSPVAIVTGGSRGIGAAIARLAGARGYDVCVNYRATAERAEAVAEEVRAAGRRAVAVQADLTRPDEVERLFEECERMLGPLDVLINNAGVSMPVRVAELEVAEIERIVATNLLGPILTARQAVRRLSTERGGKGGTIVNISSIAGVYGGLSGSVVYSASKGGLDSFTLGLAKEVGREGIRVCGVRPGLVETEMLSGARGAVEMERLGREAVPIGRIGQPEDIARAVLWLCSEEAAYVHGAILNVSGGREIFVRG